MSNTPEEIAYEVACRLRDVLPEDVRGGWNSETDVLCKARLIRQIGNNKHWWCSRKPGHAGDHIATYSKGEFICRWPQRKDS